MSTLCHDLKIGWPIIQLVTILVMHNLIEPQFAFHYIFSCNMPVHQTVTVTIPVIPSMINITTFLLLELEPHLTFHPSLSYLLAFIASHLRFPHLA